MYSQGYKKPKKFIATQGEVLGYQVCTITLYGHEVVLVYIVVGTVETVTDQLETHLLLLLLSMTTVLQTTVTDCIIIMVHCNISV